MTNKEKENFYDEKIAPDLLRLGKMCEENGLSFVCGVEWEPNEVGRTACLTADAGDGIRKANHILQFGDLSGMVSITIVPAKASA